VELPEIEMFQILSSNYITPRPIFKLSYCGFGTKKNLCLKVLLKYAILLQPLNKLKPKMIIFYGNKYVTSQEGEGAGCRKMPTDCV
jgi:hypothetical protein